MKSIAMTLQGNSFIRQNHRLIFTESDLEFLTQRVRSVISIFLGEWFLDENLGIAYIPNENDMKTAHRAILENSLRVKIIGIQGIKKFIYFNSVFNSHARELFIDFAAETDRGEILRMKETWPMPSPGGKE
jgi:hypothetical protein